MAAGVLALSSQAGGRRHERGAGGHDQSGPNRAAEKNDGWQAEGLALRAQALEQLGQMANAIAAYQDILKLNAPPAERTRQAILKIAELSIALGRFSAAEESFKNFPRNFQNSPAADLALLTLGELQLRDYTAIWRPQSFAGGDEPVAVGADELCSIFPHVQEQSARGQGVSGSAAGAFGWSKKYPKVSTTFNQAAQNLLPPRRPGLGAVQDGRREVCDDKLRGRFGKLPRGD